MPAAENSPVRGLTSALVEPSTMDEREQPWKAWFYKVAQDPSGSDVVTITAGVDDHSASHAAA
jgi:hypothetical protein